MRVPLASTFFRCVSLLKRWGQGQEVDDSDARSPVAGLVDLILANIMYLFSRRRDF